MRKGKADLSLKFVLAGNPNSGKTTLFNELTGSTAHVGNWPGVTIDRREGKYKDSMHEVDVIDLPGIYSLSPYTPEEIIARNYIIEETPDVIINIVDSTNLERNLYLTTQLLETDCPVVVALNMTDQLERQNDSIDYANLQDILGVPVVCISALRGIGMDKLMETAIKQASIKRNGVSVLQYSDLNNCIKEAAFYLKSKNTSHPIFSAIKIIEGDAHVKADEKMLDLQAKIAEQFDDIEATIADLRYQYITKYYSPVLTRSRKNDEPTHSEKIDKILTNRILGIPIFLIFMFFIFHLTFGKSLFGLKGIPSPGHLLQEGAGFIIELLAGAVTAFLEAVNSAEWTYGLIVDGMIGGVGAVLSFVPQIMLVFFFLSILEDSGYMARAAFIMDRLLRRFGLSGRSFMPMLMGFGCSVPSILATRTLESDRDRRLTMILIPYMSCGAKMPIYALFTAALFSHHSEFVVFGIYLLGITIAVISGIILKNTVLKDNSSPFILELPAYHMPRLKNLLIHIWEKLKGYIIKAGTVILASTVVIWVLSNFNFTLQMVEQNSAESILGIIGNSIKFIFVPLGFAGGTDGWKAVVAILTGVIAKEAVVSTLGVLYGGIEGAELAGDAFIATISASFSPLAALSFMGFNLLSVPCVAALSALNSEMRSSKWTLFTISFWIAMAWFVSFLIFNIGTFIRF